MSFNFVWAFKGCSNKTGCNFDDVSKIGYSSVFKLKATLNKGYEGYKKVMKKMLWRHNFCPSDVINKILSRYSNYIVNVFIPPKCAHQNLPTLAFLWQKLSWPQFYKDFTRKTNFFDGFSRFEFNNLELALDLALKCDTSLIKRLKL